MRHPRLFTLALLLLLAIAPRAMPAWVVASEFHEVATDHYLLTTSSLEAEQLHARWEWGRTAFAFRVSDGPASGLLPVCRFFGVFGWRTAHFYTMDPDECESVKHASGWVFEGHAFYAHPAQPDGSCPIGTAPVYRLYNAGREGTPNHRFTPVRSERRRMIDQGWVAEGAGADGIAFCVPVSSRRVAFARLQAFAAEEWTLFWSESTVITLTFDPVMASGDGNFPYRTEISIGGGFARWDPFLDRMTVFIGAAGVFDRLVFEFRGDLIVEGCRYSSGDAVYFGPRASFDQVLYGGCIPIGCDAPRVVCSEPLARSDAPFGFSRGSRTYHLTRDLG
jgi:hypothetical protein